MIGAYHHQSGQLSVGSGKGIEREFAHATYFGKRTVEIPVGFKRSLHGAVGLIGVQRCHGGQRCYLFVDFRVVLHGA